MSKTLEGMARAYLAERHGENSATVTVYIEDEAAMKAALLWLASNVSDEMAKAWHTANYCDGWSFDEMCIKVTGYADEVKRPISATLRAAAGSALEAKPCGAAKEG